MKIKFESFVTNREYSHVSKRRGYYALSVDGQLLCALYGAPGDWTSSRARGIFRTRRQAVEASISAPRKESCENVSKD